MGMDRLHRYFVRRHHPAMGSLSPKDGAAIDSVDVGDTFRSVCFDRCDAFVGCTIFALQRSSYIRN